MSDAPTIVLISFAPLALVVAAVATMTGWDIEILEQMHSPDTQRQQAFKRTIKINGILVAAMCAAISIGSPIAFLTDSASLVEATAALLGCGAILWLSVRWLGWASN